LQFLATGRVAGCDEGGVQAAEKGHSNERNSIVVARILTLAAVAVSGIPLVAQQASASAKQGTAVQAGPFRPVIDQARASVDMRPVSGELESKLDSKTAKVGDSVVVKTKAAVKTADGTVIPKGARLVGRVTDVQAHGSGNADSRMAILFDARS